ncbi:hypothetical protein [Streptococcus gallolyticus]|uniref:hypothetical protein n=1 Tax=Streptococcus gallolyticus TaxID=315405 RepID=UPI002283948C|nr:hypothetical protein [Streptococcus gallolyticus]MCY7192742.1 hypothetical protein [Streptococcus gallolyticus subsp. gallolyticus]
MQYDEDYYFKRVSFIKEKMNEIFRDLIIFDSEIIKFSKKGYFKLTYKYLPLEYTIIIENQGRNFTVEIRDSEGANTWLNRENPYDSNIDDLENIEIAVNNLSYILTKNNFKLYISKDGKWYRKDSNGYTRIKNMIEELYGK